MNFPGDFHIGPVVKKTPLSPSAGDEVNLAGELEIPHAVGTKIWVNN